MSQPFFSYTFMLPAAECEHAFKDEEALTDALQAAAKCREPDFGIGDPANEWQCVLQGATRNGWAHDVIGKIVAAYELPALAFLSDARSRLWLPCADRANDTWGWEVWRLDDPGIVAACAAIEAVFAQAGSDPQRFARQTRDIDAAEIALDLASTVVSMSPCGDLRIRYAEEGESGGYLFAYLRAALHLLRFARSRSRHVVHAYLTSR